MNDITWISCLINRTQQQHNINEDKDENLSSLARIKAFLDHFVGTP
jgi:hypothetical protein